MKTIHRRDVEMCSHASCLVGRYICGSPSRRFLNSLRRLLHLHVGEGKAGCASPIGSHLRIDVGYGDVEG